MKVFVTGSSGFIGSHFLSALIESYGGRAKIYCLVREAPENPFGPVEYITGDLEGIKRHAAVLAECDYVFHIAANAEYGSGTDYDAVNFKPVREMIDRLKTNGALKNFVFLSTIGAVDRENSDRCKIPVTIQSKAAPGSKYGISKLRAENYIRSSGVPFTIIRPTWVYGAGMRGKSHIQDFVTRIARGSRIYRLGFPGKVSLIHVSDLARSMVNAVENEKIIGKTYFAETGSASLGNIFKTIASGISGAEIRQIPVPSFYFLVSKIHGFLPLSINNLFINYLWASDPDYRADFDLGETVAFEKGVEDVIADNSELNGAWVITGANDGIGFALAERLRKKGERLFLVDKNTDKIRVCFPEAEYSQTDLSKEDELNSLAERLKKLKIKVLVNNAGTGFRGGVEELSERRIAETIDVNVKAPVFLVKKLIKRLRQDRSTIINVASNVAYAPLPFMSIYSSSKAFAARWTESLAYEMKDTNRVVSFSPPGTRTGFQTKAGVKVLNGGKTLMNPKDVAEKIETAVKKGENVVLLGWKTKALLMATFFLPRSWHAVIWGKLFEKFR